MLWMDNPAKLWMDNPAKLWMDNPAKLWMNNPAKFWMDSPVRASASPGASFDHGGPGLSALESPRDQGPVLTCSSWRLGR
eukprot:CAMPEP_0194499448 /NCGR_PEP_ID=MMETSP0253-20130528/15750_1 /TAXON_ID=2966 /ORGANISM="Noctiluca scintillans" /LENGTH=79 /DNA_ID=CAMNT_0039341199 /DNA_START=226 /DNA_END=465 /DNA_ORIENTATION=-